MPQIDPDWRAALKDGDRLDLLKTEQLPSGKLEGWVQGTISRVENDKLYCTLDGYPDTYEFCKNGPRISPLGARTSSWQWREKLAAKDRVDALDTQHKWYLGTVLDVRVNSDGAEEAFVGYRYYTHDGSKIDSNGERFEGWSGQHDAWMNRYSLCIQP